MSIKKNKGILFIADHASNLIPNSLKNIHLKGDYKNDSNLSSDNESEYRKIFAKLNELGYNGLYTLQGIPDSLQKESGAIKKYVEIFKEIHNEC